MNPERKPNPALIAIIIVVLLTITASVTYAATRPSEKTTQPSTSETTADNTSSSVASQNTSGNYKDGTYEAKGSYSTPGGRESIDLTVTLTNGVITSSTISGSGSTGDSREYQSRFTNGYKSLVVGKNIEEVSLSRVAGSSLTSNGFNDALEQIKTDAKA